MQTKTEEIRENRGPTPAACRNRRELAAACAVLAAATLVCFHKLALHPADVLVGPQKQGHNDLTDYFIASREFAAASVREGEWPLWNPYLCLGEPYTGNPQSALYYPPNWVTLIWNARVSLSWLLVAHHFFAGLGAYCLARRYGLSWTSALLAGVVFLGAPYLVVQAAEGHYPQICAVAWIPWSFLAYESFRARCTRRANGEAGPAESSAWSVAAIVGSLSLCFFCGHAQETYYLVLLLTGCVAADAARLCRQGSRRAAGTLIGGWCCAGVLTAGVVSIDLLPTFLATLRSARPTLQSTSFGWTALNVSSLRELFDPFALTRPELWHGGMAPFWEKLFFFGVLPLVLALIGGIRNGRRPPALRFGVLWVVTVVFAFAARGAAFDALSAAIPGLSWFRVPSRILFFTSFATAVLAACGLQVVLQAARTRPVLARCLAATAIGGCVLELGWFSSQVTDTAVLRRLDDRSPELARLLAGSAPDHRVLAVQEVLNDADATALHVPKVNGYEPAGPAAYLLVSRLLQGDAQLSVDPAGFLPADPLRLDQRWLRLLGVRYAVRSERQPAAELPDGWSAARSLELPESLRRREGHGSARSFSCEVLELESPLPRAYVVGEVRASAGLGEFVAAWPLLNPEREVSLARDVLPAGPRAEFAPAQIVSESSRRLTVEARLDAAGYLVVSDLWFPGWTASVNGAREVPVLQANGLFRAVPLPAGVQRVEFRYVPRGLYVGSLLSLFTLLILAWPLWRWVLAAFLFGKESRSLRSGRLSEATRGLKH